MKMNNVWTRMLATGLVMSGAAMAATSPVTVFSPAQEARVGEVAKAYLLAHPEVLMEVSDKLQEKQELALTSSMKRAVITHQAELIGDKHTPSFGPSDAKVVVTEFFDYQCIYCARLAPLLDKAIKSNPQVRFMFREWPIFAGRWERSLTAAKTGLQVWQQKGPQAYLRYHNALFATGHNEGKLTTEDIWKAAGMVELDSGKARDVTSDLDKTSQLAQAIGLRGTPGVIVMPASGATEENITVFPGTPDDGALQAAISKAMTAAKG